MKASAVLVRFILVATPTIIIGLPNMKNALVGGSSSTCRSGWSPGPGPGGQNCYKFSQPYYPPTWFKSGEYCSTQNSYQMMPKTEKQLEFIMGMWQNYYMFWTPDTGIYVGVQGFAGYWGWLDNSTFNNSLWCKGVDHKLTNPEEKSCVIVKNVVPYNPHGGFCFDRVQCTHSSWFYATICQDILVVDESFCPKNWLGRPETNEQKKECYYISAKEQKTTWVEAFCYCLDQKSVLANVVTWEEAVWLAGNLLNFHREETVLLGLSALDYSLGWMWTDGTPLQNYTKYFWISGHLPHVPSPTAPPDEGNRCSVLFWINDDISLPRLRTYDCESGYTNFVCKMTPDTAKGEFSDMVLALRSKYC